MVSTKYMLGNIFSRSGQLVIKTNQLIELKRLKKTYLNNEFLLTRQQQQQQQILFIEGEIHYYR